MRQFPNTPEYTGLNTPLGEEYEIDSLAVEGRIPADVEGVFFRAVPDPAFPPFVEDGGAVLSGGRHGVGRSFCRRQGRLLDPLCADRAPQGRGGCGARAVRQVPQSLHRQTRSEGPRPHGRQHHARLACRAPADDQGGRPAVPRRSALARDPGSSRLRRQAQVRNDDGARANRPRDGRDVLLRLRGRRPCVDEGRVLHRRQAGQPDPRAVVRRAVLRADARFRRHGASCAVSGLSDHLRCRPREGGRRPLGARDGPRELGRRDAALRRRL